MKEVWQAVPHMTVQNGSQNNSWRLQNGFPKDQNGSPGGQNRTPKGQKSEKSQKKMIVSFKKSNYSMSPTHFYRFLVNLGVLLGVIFDEEIVQTSSIFSMLFF